MRAQDLRIGNLVNEYGIPTIIDSRMLQGIESANEGNKIIIDLSYIPLTEEWLLKFGFYKNIDTELFEKSGFQIDFSVIKCHFYLPNYGDWYNELEFVHQLQNLYFALTGEELSL